MENQKDLKTTVDEFLEEENKDFSKDETECTTQECKMKSGKGLIERVDKKYITNDGRELLIN